MNWCKALLSSPPSPVSDRLGKNAGFCDADLCVGCDHDLFRLADVRPALQQFRGKAGRNVLGDGLFGKRASAGNGLGIFAEQNAKHVLLLLNLPLEIGDRFRGGVDELLCLAHVEPRSSAMALKRTELT